GQGGRRRLACGAKRHYARRRRRERVGQNDARIGAPTPDRGGGGNPLCRERHRGAWAAPIATTAASDAGGLSGSFFEPVATALGGSDRRGGAEGAPSGRERRRATAAD